MDAAKTKEMMTKLVNRAIADLAPLRQASSLFNASKSLHSMYCVGDETKKYIDQMKRDADAEFAQVNQRAKELRYQGNIFQMAAQIEAHQKQKFMQEMQKKQMAMRQHHMKQMQAAEKERARREQEKRYHAMLKEASRQEDQKKNKNSSSSSSATVNSKQNNTTKFKGLKKGFLSRKSEEEDKTKNASTKKDQ